MDYSVNDYLSCRYAPKNERTHSRDVFASLFSEYDVIGPVVNTSDDLMDAVSYIAADSKSLTFAIPLEEPVCPPSKLDYIRVWWADVKELRIDDISQDFWVITEKIPKQFDKYLVPEKFLYYSNEHKCFAIKLNKGYLNSRMIDYLEGTGKLRYGDSTGISIYKESIVVRPKKKYVRTINEYYNYGGAGQANSMIVGIVIIFVLLLIFMIIYCGVKYT